MVTFNIYMEFNRLKHIVCVTDVEIGMTTYLLLSNVRDVTESVSIVGTVL